MKDKLDIMIALSGDALIEHNLAVGVAGELPDVVVPVKLDRKIRRMISHESGKAVYNDFAVRVRKIAAAFLIACSLCLAMAMSVEAVREAFWNAIVEWFDEYIAVIFIPEQEPPKVIEEYREPRLVPVGCERRVEGVSRGFFTVSYYIDEKKVLQYSQSVLYTSDTLHDNDTETFDSKIINNKETIIINSQDEIKLIWYDKDYIFELTNYYNFTISELKIISESIS